jgi:hypothetical protein
MRKVTASRRRFFRRGWPTSTMGLRPGEPVLYASLAFDGQKPFTRLYDTVEGGAGNEWDILLSLTIDPPTNVVAGKSFTAKIFKQATFIRVGSFSIQHVIHVYI